MGKKRKTADLSAVDFKYRLHLLAKSKNKTGDIKSFALILKKEKKNGLE